MGLIEGDKVRTKLTNQFTTLFNEEFPVLAGLPARRKWAKPKLLPLTEDIQKLNAHLDKVIEECSVALHTGGFNEEIFYNLSKTLLLKICVFNKRVGESQRFSIVNFKKRTAIDEKSESYKMLSQAEKILTKKYVKFDTPGKCGRPVPIMLNQKQVEIIENVILNSKYRQLAEIPADKDFLFARFDTTFNLCHVMRMI